MDSLQANFHPTLNQLNLYSDARTHGYQGRIRNVRLYRALPAGGGFISPNKDNTACAVAGKESLRTIRVSSGSGSVESGHKFAIGPGGYRVDASRNFWDGSGLKIDSASTDVAWAYGAFNAKILTSARNGELIMWDVNKSGVSKYERRSRDHIRSINALSVSHVVHHYCITGSADGDLRVWDLRDLSRSIMRIHHAAPVRSVAFSPSVWQPLQAVVGLDNGSICRWDLKMGQKGSLDRLVVAHTASVTALDWRNLAQGSGQNGSSYTSTEGSGNGLGWLVSGSLDRCVKIWDLSTPNSNSRIPHKPTYTLHPSFPVRRVIWRPGYECELAVISNTEFGSGSNPDLAQEMSAGSVDSSDQNGNGGRNKLEGRSTASRPLGGDPIEIWDVRRGWIAKWCVVGSGIEGGVTDLAFGDANAIWAQHSSGSFSQIDLRSCVKPLDAILPTVATWEASGSLAFVAQRSESFQIPYDDMTPEVKDVFENRYGKLKALGDPRYFPSLQDFGTLMGDDVSAEALIFDTLAREYVTDGDSRSEVCDRNSRVALDAGKHHACQMWSLLGACLTQTLPRPPSSTSSGPEPSASQLAKSSSSKFSVATAHRPSYSLSTSYDAPTQLRKVSPSRISNHSLDNRTAHASSTSASRKMTPASSKSSSPRQLPGDLPPITPRRPSGLSGKDFYESDMSRRPSISLYRRPSLSAPTAMGLSPRERSVTSSSLRYVGEGALDDSDSSSEAGSLDGQIVDDQSSDEEAEPKPLISPVLHPVKGIAGPSPLSRVVGQRRWDEESVNDADHDDDDDDEEASPSPRSSTDTDSSEPSSPEVPRSRSKNSKSRFAGRMKSRSRSSTVASLAALPPKPLEHSKSSSSVRTVTAGEPSLRDVENEAHMMHARKKSQALSEFALDPPLIASPEEVEPEQTHPEDLTERRIEIVRADERRYHEHSWNIIRKALELFIEEGDVQMCAMLAIVAADELRISKRRAIRFLDSYIDLLSRRRLFTCAAHIRKYCKVKVIRDSTLVETTLYTTCARCKKPLLVSATAAMASGVSKGGYSYCLACKAACTTCAICRLPVRTLLFQCPVCSHGGHHACYRRYYKRQRMVELPSASNPMPLDLRPHLGRNQSLSNVDEDGGSTISTRSSLVDSSIEDSPTGMSSRLRMLGHPCAAGCGHFCWASTSDTMG